MPFRIDKKTNLSILKLRNLYNLKSYQVGQNNWGIFLILLVTTVEGIGPTGEISPVVCMLKNGLISIQRSLYSGEGLYSGSYGITNVLVNKKAGMQGVDWQKREEFEAHASTLLRNK